MTTVLVLHALHKIPAPKTHERLMGTRTVIDTKDAPGGFSLGAHGVSYVLGERRVLVPWTSVRYLETTADEPAAKKGAK